LFENIAKEKQNPNEVNKRISLDPILNFIQLIILGINRMPIGNVIKKKRKMLKIVRITFSKLNVVRVATLP
jgi:hypothetical protein